MTVNSATQVNLTARTAEPPKQSTPAQPWQATGLTYYHNKYVGQAADYLGCCGVTHLLIVEENSIPNRVGKMALFVIASICLAMVDVIRAAWTMISGSRSVAPIAPVAGNRPIPTTTVATAPSSTTEVPSKSAAVAKPKPTETARKSSPEETQEEEEDSAQTTPSSKSPEYNHQAIKAIAKQASCETGKLADALYELQCIIGGRPPAARLTEALTEVGDKANVTKQQLEQDLSKRQTRLIETNEKIRALQTSLIRLNDNQRKFVLAAAKLYPDKVAAALDVFEEEDVPPPPISSSHQASLSSMPFFGPPTSSASSSSASGLPPMSSLASVSAQTFGPQPPVFFAPGLPLSNPPDGPVPGLLWGPGSSSGDAKVPGANDDGTPYSLSNWSVPVTQLDDEAFDNE